jgi:hypothetical protein
MRLFRVEFMGAGRVNVGPKVDALYLMLRLDARRYLSGSGMTAKALSRHCDIPDRLLRGMHERDWNPTLKTLLRIERALSKEPHWPARDVNSWHEAEDDVGFIICRNRTVTQQDAMSFDEVLEAYNGGRSDGARLDALEPLPNVTIIDVSATPPTEFFIVKHAEISRAARGVDNKGKRLRDFQGKTYRDVLMQDCLRAKYTGDSLFNDVLWANFGTTEGSFFQRLMLPLGAHIVSAVNFQFTGIGRRFDYSEFNGSLDT